VAGAADLALDEEKVRAVLRAKWTEPASGGGGRCDGSSRTRSMELVDPAGDQVLANRLGVGLREKVVDVAVGSRTDLREDGVRIVLAGLDALEVQDREPTEAGEFARQPRVDDSVHR
jgi:hypothetical protein